MATSSSDSQFRGRTVLITGASLGVGRATAHAFHAAGANVALIARRAGPLEEAAAGLKRALILPADVCDANAMRDALATTVEHFGGLDGVVNNAGAHFRGPLEERSVDEIATMVDVNLRAPLVLTCMALPYLRESSAGFVVNVASLAGKVPLDRAATYSATKFGLRAFTYAMAQELKDSGITVSVVSPGPIDTSFIMDELDEVEDIVFSQKMCSADDVAAMILACARDGKVEREFPALGGLLATVGYLFPGIRQRLKPYLSEKGRKAKQRLREQR
ncbi:MAG: SDR family NAD(P)-dependent oxidoreductase [Bradymonadaceae bacterium]|nr:SDR family NAD(P)-dependent oxidoreductase [Lujinxingiaceae bacterium]